MWPKCALSLRSRWLVKHRVNGSPSEQVFCVISYLVFSAWSGIYTIWYYTSMHSLHPWTVVTFDPLVPNYSPLLTLTLWKFMLNDLHSNNSCAKRSSSFWNLQVIFFLFTLWICCFPFVNYLSPDVACFQCNIANMSYSW